MYNTYDADQEKQGRMPETTNGDTNNGHNDIE
jgi:hypothetical protein